MNTTQTTAKPRQSTVTFNLKPLDDSVLMDSAELVIADRCDRCQAQAFVRARSQEGGELMFCGNHARHSLASLVTQGFKIDDQTHRINQEPSVSANA